MTAQEIKQLIAAGEGLRTEFKREIDDASDIAAEIVAFANTEGGMLLLGVADNKTIYGVEDIEALERRLMGIVRANCRPAPVVLPFAVELERKTILALKVEKGIDKPYSTSRDHYYVQVGSTKRRATKEGLYRLFQSSGLLQYDVLGAPGTSLEDIDLIKLGEYYRQVYNIDIGQRSLTVPIERLLVNAGILTEVNDRIIATIGGILCFGKEPESVLPQSGILAAQYDGLEITSRIADKRDIFGTLDEIIEGAIGFVRLHNVTSANLDMRPREEHSLFPFYAAKEAIINLNFVQILLI